MPRASTGGGSRHRASLPAIPPMRLSTYVRAPVMGPTQPLARVLPGPKDAAQWPVPVSAMDYASRSLRSLGGDRVTAQASHALCFPSPHPSCHRWTLRDARQERSPDAQGHVMTAQSGQPMLMAPAFGDHANSLSPPFGMKPRVRCRRRFSSVAILAQGLDHGA